MITILSLVAGIYHAVYIAVGVAGIVGGILVLSTRSDAFEAAGRQSRTNWALMLFFSALFLIMPIGLLSFLSWAGAVIIGVYWFDVRPQIRDILNGNYSW